MKPKSPKSQPQIEDSAFLASPEDATPVPAEKEDAQEAAFLNSATHLWKGKPINPYTALRESVAQSMGLRYGTGRISKADWEEFKATNSYTGMYDDIVIVLWLCIDATEQEIWAARSQPKEALKTAYEWADGARILRPENLFDAAILLARITNEVAASTGTYQTPDETAEEGKAGSKKS